MLTAKQPLPSFLKDLNIESIIPITGDGGHRKYYRLKSSNTTYVLMYDIEIKRQYNDTQEHNFAFVNVHKILEENNVSVPSIKKIVKEENCLLLEDLGDCNLYNTKKNTLQLYEKSLNELIKIQNIKKDLNLPTFQKSFDVDFLITELAQSLINIYNYYNPNNLLKSLPKELNREIATLCNFLETSSFCLVHRDYHSRNIMVIKEQVKIIDFQDARLGHPLYDLASLLEDPYTKLSQDIKIDFKKYFQKQASLLVLDDFETHYHSISIHRLLKASASFIKLAKQDSNKVHNYLIDLPYAIKQSYNYVMKLNYPKLQAFINTLCNHQ